MDTEQFEYELNNLFHPEPDEDGMVLRQHPHPHLTELHGLDFAYMDSLTWEGASTHPYSRMCRPGDDRILSLTRNSDVSTRLFRSALRLFGDSVVAYEGKAARKGELRYYPPTILTFWSGFETFVRYSSELLLATVPTVPAEIARFLREEESQVEGNGTVSTRSQFRPVLHRYVVLLRYAYGLRVDRGSPYWQRLEAAKTLRDYYTHLDVNDPRPVSSEDVLAFMESVLLSIIWPSSLLQRSLLLGMYDLHEIWVFIKEHATLYVEQPLFIDWPLAEGYSFHCNFEGVDTRRFPNMADRARTSEDGGSESSD